MKIIWDWSLESETNRLMQSARNIGNGFYALQNFYPLPWTKSNKYLTCGVYLPLIKYQSIPRFWFSASRLDDHNLPMHTPPTIARELQSFLTPLSLTEPDYHTLASTFETTTPQVLSFIKHAFPTIPLPSQITIYPTYFGTTGSFNWMTSAGQVVIYHRIDQGIRSLVECLLTSIIRPHALKHGNGGWSETEFLVDYLLQYSALNQIVPLDPSWSPTHKNTAVNKTSVRDKSVEFLRTIGAPTSNTQKFSIHDDQVYFDNKALPSLSRKESLILHSLVRSAPQPISIDTIADLIFTKEDKFSLSAINKTIERLRKKLATLGISSSYIATASGVGYYLKN